MKKRHKTFKLIIASVLLVGLALAIWSILIEPNRLIVHSETITVKNWPQQLNGLKIVALSDIHAGSLFINETKLRQIVSLVNAQQPDLIVLLGDYMVRDRFYRNPMEPEKIAAAMKDLKAPLGVYAVLGNHDWYFDGPRVRRAFERNGIKVLDNEVAETKKDSASLWLVGLADLWTRPQDIQATVAKVPSGATIIALTHNPDTFVQLPANVPLLLAGHTHGGQVNLPLLGRLVVPSNYGQRYAAGHVEENGRHLFVTTGIGTSILPLRFRVTPEIAVLTLE
ncbi:MAG TPA: metallophosphoesterase [Pyrinomonadaceae bacterium]